MTEPSMRNAVAALGAMALIASLVAPGGAHTAVHAADATQAPASSRLTIADGAIVRGPTNAARIALLFTGHEFAEVGETILEQLSLRRIRASFFLTGAFLDQPSFASLVRRMVKDGHYVGPHSDAHLLYCPWTGPKTTLVSRAVFDADLDANLKKLARFGVPHGSVSHFVPPYEWSNAEIAAWSGARGLRLLNPTPGTRAAADYTEEKDPRFVPSQAIFDSILARETSDPDGLRGFLLLMHIGAGPGRRDKFADRLGELLDALTARGYGFVRVDELVPADGR